MDSAGRGLLGSAARGNSEVPGKFDTASAKVLRRNGRGVGALAPGEATRRDHARGPGSFMAALARPRLPPCSRCAEQARHYTTMHASDRGFSGARLAHASKQHAIQRDLSLSCLNEFSRTRP